jgi:multimeric flavodoxin WrbA
MAIVSVVYHSPNGHTRRLAEHVAAGARGVQGTEVHLVEIIANQVVEGRWEESAIIKVLRSADAIVFGSPTLMGSVSAVFKAFLEAAFYEFLEQGWKDKIAGGFTNSASQSGDKLMVLQQLAIFAAQLNMLWVPVGDPPGNNWSGGSRDDLNRLGSWLGLMSQSNADQGPESAGSLGDMATAARYGARIAQLTSRWTHGTPYTTERYTEDEFRQLTADVALKAATWHQ